MRFWGGPGAGAPKGCNRNRKMKLTLKPSTGRTIVVWREDDTYCARRVGEASEPEVCLAVDLFEVLAELAELDLESNAGAAEAVQLSEEAQHRLREDEPDEGPSQRRRRTL